MTFQEENLVAKLATLTNTAVSIQMVATWIIYHRRASEKIAQTCLSTALQSYDPEKLYTYLCLFNDVLQRGKKNGPEFSHSFSSEVLLPIFKHTAKICKGTVFVQKVFRLLLVWQERNVVATNLILELFQYFNTGPEKTGYGQKNGSKENIELEKAFDQFPRDILDKKIVELNKELLKNLSLSGKVNDISELVYSKEYISSINESDAANVWLDKLQSATMTVASFRDSLLRQISMLSGLFEVIQELQKHCELQISRTKLLVERQETNLNSLQENIITLTYQTSVDLKKKRKVSIKESF
jgi:hypothetical protein